MGVFNNELNRVQTKPSTIEGNNSGPRIFDETQYRHDHSKDPVPPPTLVDNERIQFRYDTKLEDVIKSFKMFVISKHSTIATAARSLGIDTRTLQRQKKAGKY